MAEYLLADVVNNQVGDVGALALVASLVRMTWFSIGSACPNVEVNQLSEVCKECCKSMAATTMWITI